MMKILLRGYSQKSERILWLLKLAKKSYKKLSYNFEIWMLTLIPNNNNCIVKNKVIYKYKKIMDFGIIGAK